MAGLFGGYDMLQQKCCSLATPQAMRHHKQVDVPAMQELGHPSSSFPAALAQHRNEAKSPHMLLGCNNVQRQARMHVV